MLNVFLSPEIKVAISPLSELAKEYKMLPDRVLNSPIENYMHGLHSDINDLDEGTIQNKIDGLRREIEVYDELKQKYPETEGYEIVPETYLRDKDGNIVRDPVTGEGRRIDYVVVKDNKVVDSVEVTSPTADKTEQCAKEQRIREAGGNYVKTADGSLAEFPSDTQTRIDRRE